MRVTGIVIVRKDGAEVVALLFGMGCSHTPREVAAPVAAVDVACAWVAASVAAPVAEVDVSGVVLLHRRGAGFVALARCQPVRE